MKKIGIVKDKSFLSHSPNFPHPESPERLIAINQVIESENILNKGCIILTPKFANPEEIELVHTSSYVKKIEDTSMTDHSMLDGDTYASKETFKTALLAAGSLIDCVEKVTRGELDSAFAFVRPPGHHAEKDRAMGFCIFNNVAIGAAYALKKLGLKKVAIIDIDLHHGNGTQNSFWDTDEVLYISTHQFPYYPGTGSMAEIGSGKGKGFTVNIPLPVGFGDPEYTKIYKEIVQPILLDYHPQLIFVSAGFDIHKDDPLGGMHVSKDGFSIIGSAIKEAAEETCGGKVVYTLEGGYSPIGLQEGSLNILKTLIEDQPSKETKIEKITSGEPLSIIEKIANNLRSYWNL